MQRLVADAGQVVDIGAARLGHEHARHQVDAPGAQIVEAAQEGRLAPVQFDTDTLGSGFQHADQWAAG